MQKDHTTDRMTKIIYNRQIDITLRVLAYLDNRDTKNIKQRRSLNSVPYGPSKSKNNGALTLTRRLPAPVIIVSAPLRSTTKKASEKRKS